MKDTGQVRDAQAGGRLTVRQATEYLFDLPDDDRSAAPAAKITLSGPAARSSVKGSMPAPESDLVVFSAHAADFCSRAGGMIALDARAPVHVVDLTFGAWRVRELPGAGVARQLADAPREAEAREAAGAPAPPSVPRFRRLPLHRPRRVARPPPSYGRRPRPWSLTGTTTPTTWTTRDGPRGPEGRPSRWFPVSTRVEAHSIPAISPSSPPPA
jgi:hypothetical protein